MLAVCDDFVYNALHRWLRDDLGGKQKKQEARKKRLTPPATHGKMLSQGWEWFPPQVRKEDSRMFKKIAIENFKKNGTDNEKALALEIERLNKLVTTWRNRVPADKRAEYAGKKVEVKHRYHVFFDGRSYEQGKRIESAITCPDKNNGCPNCKRPTTSYIDTY